MKAIIKTNPKNSEPPKTILGKIWNTKILRHKNKNAGINKDLYVLNVI